MKTSRSQAFFQHTGNKSEQRAAAMWQVAQMRSFSLLQHDHAGFLFIWNLPSAASGMSQRSIKNSTVSDLFGEGGAGVRRGDKLIYRGGVAFWWPLIAGSSRGPPESACHTASCRRGGSGWLKSRGVCAEHKTVKCKGQLWSLCELHYYRR